MKLKAVNGNKIATLFAILAAALYAINIPLSKLLLEEVGTTMMAAFLYLGAGLGMLSFCAVRSLAENILIQKKRSCRENAASAGVENETKHKRRASLTKVDLPYTIAMVVALTVGESIPAFKWILLVLLLGFVAYGLSINFYIMAQKDLGAAKTSAYYSVAPFLGVAFSMVLVGERPGIQFYVGLAVMVVATIIMAKDTMEVGDDTADETGNG